MFGNKANNSWPLTIRQASTPSCIISQTPPRSLMRDALTPILQERWPKLKESSLSAHGHLPSRQPSRHSNPAYCKIHALNHSGADGLQSCGFTNPAPRSTLHPPHPPASAQCLSPALHFYSCSSPFLNQSPLLHRLVCILSGSPEALPLTYGSLTRFRFILIALYCRIHWSVMS